jgi:hypothetical protein
VLGIDTYPDGPDPAKWCGSDPIRGSTTLLKIVNIFVLLFGRLSFEELGEHPFLELENSVPGPNTLARLNIALDAATAAGKFTHWLHLVLLLAVLRIRIRDPVPFWPLDPGSGIGFSRIPDLGSRIPNPYFRELNDNFLGKKLNNSLKIVPNFFSSAFQT